MLLISLIGFVYLVVNRDKLNLRNETDGQIKNSPVSVPKSPQTLDALLRLPPAELNRCDIALMDLLCAQGLPGTENLNISGCLANLDQWANHVQSETERNLHQFREKPGDYYNSEGYFRMLIMAVVMYEDFGVRYNPDRIVMPQNVDANDHFFADSRDIFLHGLVGDRRMGTCSSMPVLYIAIGRRMAIMPPSFMSWCIRPAMSSG